MRHIRTWSRVTVAALALLALGAVGFLGVYHLANPLIGYEWRLSHQEARL